jgi:hypothetical protein
VSVTESRRVVAQGAQGQELEPAGDAGVDLLGMAPGLLRVGLQMYARTALWSVQASLDAAQFGLRLATHPDQAQSAITGLAQQLRDTARRALGVEELAERVEEMPDPHANGKGESEFTLRQRGAELLARSAEVGTDEGFTHPAYERILTSLAPDEARILRLMAQEGPRAAVDVRTWRPLDVGSEMVAPGLTMIGQEAGCRFVERVPAYLNNLYRLGLIWFSRESLPEQAPYQVLEAQPEVQAALRKAGRGKTIRRSIRLTPFGIDFCETCLPLDTAAFLAVQRRLSGDVGTEPPPGGANGGGIAS